MFQKETVDFTFAPFSIVMLMNSKVAIPLSLTFLFLANASARAVVVQASSQTESAVATVNASYKQSSQIQTSDASRSNLSQLIHRAEHQYKFGSYRESALTYEQALALARRGGDRVQETAILSALGLSLSSLSAEDLMRRDILGLPLSNYEEAFRRYEESLEVARLAESQEGVAIAVAGLGRLYTIGGDYARAKKALEESLSIFRSIDAQSREADVLNSLGVLEKERTMYQLMLPPSPNSTTALPEGAVVSSPEISLEPLQSSRGYTDALLYFEQSLTLSKSIGSLEEEAIALANIGEIYKQQRKYEQALSYLQQAMEITKALEMPTVSFDILRHIGGTYEAMERYETAVETYRESLTIDRHFDEENIRTDRIKLLANAASKTLSVHEQTRADFQRTFIWQTLEEHIQNEATDEKSKAQALKDACLIYSQLKRGGNFFSLDPVLISLAIEHCQQSLSISRELADTFNELDALKILGSIQGRKGEWMKAIDYYAQSADLVESLDQINDIAFAVSDTLSYAKLSYMSLPEEYTNTASGEYVHADISAMISLYEGALTLLYKNLLNKKHTATEENLIRIFTPGFHCYLSTELSQMYWKVENFERAISLLTERMPSMEEEGICPSQSLSETPLSGTLVNYRMTAPITALMNNLSDADIAARLSLTNIFNHKGVNSEGLARAASRGFSSNEAEANNLLLELKELITVRSNIYFNESYNSSVVGDGGRDYAEPHNSRDTEVIDSSISALMWQLNTIEEEPVQTNSLVDRNRSMIDQVIPLIPTEAALVEFTVYQPYESPSILFDMSEQQFSPLNPNGPKTASSARYAAYILTREGKVQAVDLGETATIDRQIARYNQALRTQNNQISKISRELDEMLMSPIRPLLSDKTQLLISPDGQLNTMPFDSLVDSQGRYLLQSYQISYLNTGRDLIRLQQHKPSQKSPVIVANPAYGSSSLVGNDVAELDGEQRATDPTTLTFSELPGTAEEGDKILSFLPDATLLSEQQATESVFKQISSPSILHVATHGFFLSDIAASTSYGDVRSTFGASFELVGSEAEGLLMPDFSTTTYSGRDETLLRSGLALAGVNNRSSGSSGRTPDDGILSAFEAVALDLTGTQLVVLSACETGVGIVTNGGGVYGLRRAFDIAGAASQLMSLWRIDDYGTSQLMQIYYENLIGKNQGRGEALRNAQLELIDTGTYKHPYYWASFVLIGDWSPMDL